MHYIHTRSNVHVYVYIIFQASVQLFHHIFLGFEFDSILAYKHSIEVLVMTLLFIFLIFLIFYHYQVCVCVLGVWKIESLVAALWFLDLCLCGSSLICVFVCFMLLFARIMCFGDVANLGIFDDLCRVNVAFEYGVFWWKWSGCCGRDGVSYDEVCVALWGEKCLSQWFFYRVRF